MKTIAMVSANGGVGKTTLAANLGAALIERRLHVTGISLGPQNALGLHSKPLPESPVHTGHSTMSRGAGGLHAVTGGMGSEVPSRAVAPMPFGAGAHRAGATTGSRAGSGMRSHGMSVIHLGESREAQRLSYERQVEANPDWLRGHLERLQLPGDGIVLIDTPSGRSPYLSQALAVADLVVVVVAADVMSFASLTAVHDLFANYRNDLKGSSACCYAINRFDSRRALHKDVVKVVRAALGSRVYPMPIHDDAAIGEALAHDTNVLTYRSTSQASEEFRRLAAWTLERLEQPAEV